MVEIVLIKETRGVDQAIRYNSKSYEKRGSKVDR